MAKAKSNRREKMERESLELANYMMETGCTVMELQSKFSIPKSTVHYRLSKSLASISLDHWDACQHILKAYKADALNRACKARKGTRAQ